MSQIVTDERGQQHEFPDEATPQMILQALGRAPKSAVRDYAEQAAHGVARGIAALPGIAGDIPTMAGNLLEWGASKIAPETTAAVAPKVRAVTSLFTPPTSAETIGAAERNVIGERPEPGSTGSRIVGDLAQALPASLIPIGGPAGAANLARQGLTGMLSAGSAIGAREMGLPTWAQVGAGLLPGAAMSAGNVISGRTGASGLVREATKNLSPEDWKAGAATQAEARAAGIPLMGQESLAPPVGAGPLGELASNVAATRAGGPIMNQVVQRRPAEITQAVKSATARIGPEASADKVASSLRDVAQTTVKAFDKNRIKRTNGLYQAGDKVRIPAETVNPIISEVDAAIAAAPSEGALTTELQALRRKLLVKDGSPQTLSSALNQTKKELESKIRPSSGMDAGGDLRAHAGIIGPIVSRIRTTLHDNNNYYAKADALYRDLTKEMDSVLGTPDNPTWVRRLAETDSNSKARSLLLDPENMSPDTIRNIADMFRGQGRLDDLAAFMRHALENDFNTSARQLQSGANPAMGAKFGNAVYGTEKQRANLNAYWDQIDRTGGAGRGLETLFKITDRSARTPGMGSQTASRLGTNETLASSPQSTAAQVGAGAIMSATGVPGGQLAGGYLIGNAILGKIRQAYLNLGAAKIAKALTDPDSVGKLRTLAKKDPASPAAATAVLALLGGLAKSKESE